MGDFVLVELPLEEGRNVGSIVCYVAQVLGIEDGGMLNLSFLRMKATCILKNTFHFPYKTDVLTVDREQCKGVLVVRKEGTKRQAGTIKVYPPPLSAFRMHS